jgi:hypothetical protein
MPVSGSIWPLLVPSRRTRGRRKTPTTVFRVATEQGIQRRLGLDLLRERSVRGLAATTGTLHNGRAARS